MWMPVFLTGSRYTTYIVKYCQLAHSDRISYSSAVKTLDGARLHTHLSHFQVVVWEKAHYWACRCTILVLGYGIKS